jgi:hypothetical protein
MGEQAAEECRSRYEGSETASDTSGDALFDGVAGIDGYVGRPYNGKE